jgi:hypothetical protein
LGFRRGWNEVRGKTEGMKEETIEWHSDWIKLLGGHPGLNGVPNTAKVGMAKAGSRMNPRRVDTLRGKCLIDDSLSSSNSTSRYIEWDCGSYR